MMRRTITSALMYINNITGETGKSDAEYGFRKAEILALIAIAEELEKINKREEEKDKPWEKGLGL